MGRIDGTASVRYSTPRALGSASHSLRDISCTLRAVQDIRGFTRCRSVYKEVEERGETTKRKGRGRGRASSSSPTAGRTWAAIVGKEGSALNRLTTD